MLNWCQHAAVNRVSVYQPKVAHRLENNANVFPTIKEDDCYHCIDSFGKHTRRLCTFPLVESDVSADACPSRNERPMFIASHCSLEVIGFGLWQSALVHVTYALILTSCQTCFKSHVIQ